MVNILHRVGIVSSVDEVYSALTTIDGLAGWWTTETQGDPELGGVIVFDFGDAQFDMKVTELQPGKRVLWEVVGGPDEWLGTEISFDIEQSDDYAIVLFAHRGWREPVEFMHHCSTKWATFLISLKSLVEAGKGAPAPHDVKIDNWN